MCYILYIKSKNKKKKLTNPVFCFSAVMLRLIEDLDLTVEPKAPDFTGLARERCCN